MKKLCCCRGYKKKSPEVVVCCRDDGLCSLTSTVMGGGGVRVLKRAVNGYDRNFLTRRWVHRHPGKACRNVHQADLYNRKSFLVIFV